MRRILEQSVIGLGPVLLVAVFALADCSEVTAQHSQTELVSNGRRRTGKFTLLALGDNRLSDYEQLTQRHDLLIASHLVSADLISAFRQRNPGSLVLAYFNTSDVNADWIKDPYYARLWDATNPHEDWFHHTPDGQRVRIYFPKYRQRYAFNTGNPKLQEYLAAQVVEILDSGLYDGVQLDNVSTEFPGAVAVNPSPHVVSLSLPEPYRTLAGKTVEKLEMPPHEAIILLGPGH